MTLWSRIERRLNDLADRVDDILPDEFREQIQSARRLIEQSKPREAVEMLQALLMVRPDHVTALLLVGAAQLELAQFQAAGESFDRVLAVRPEFPEALVGRGQAHLGSGELELAIGAFGQAVRSAGGDRSVLAEAYRGLGIAYRRRGELDKAIRELRKAVAEASEDPLARAALGEALLADDQVSSEEARRQLQEAARVTEPPALALLALGRLALIDADHAAARTRFTDALARAATQEERFTALEGLGDAELAAGDTAAAHQQYLKALELEPKRSSLHARLGALHRRVRNHDAALESYERALEQHRDSATLRDALETALEADRLQVAVRLANELLAVDPNDTRALVARGIALARSSDTEAARATFAAVLARGSDLHAHLALARLELDATPNRSGGISAAAAALAALREEPTNPLGRELLAEARARELDLDTRERCDSRDDSDMYQVAVDLQRVALARSELSDLVSDAAQAASDFDQPLLVTVMGEFSSGKSSFVNAFLGHEIAATGITPTTATINVVKYGRERGGRIIGHDGSVRTLDVEELYEALHALEPEAVRAIERVEILFPLPLLERVNIVDTPGLNSIVPEHEEVARGFISRADAVIWVFTAGQGGKASERAALESIRGEGKRVLGVLNKRDQLSAADADAVIGHIAAELGDIVELVVPFSAREALAYKRLPGATTTEDQRRNVSAVHADDNAADGNWLALASALEERFFAHARELKRNACSRRLSVLLERARGRVRAEEHVAQQAAASLRDAATTLEETRLGFVDATVARERARLSEQVASLYRRAAREVLELVRPRRLPFGSHSATPADRDYLISLLDSGYEAALAASRRAVLAELGSYATAAGQSGAAAADIIGNEAVGDIARTGLDAVRLVEARVYERCRAYLQGYLRGGYVDSLFRRDLPKLELTEDAVYHALYRDAPDLDQEITLRLATAGTEALDSLAQRLEHWAGVAEVLAYDLEVGIGRALDSLDARRRALESSQS